MARPAKTDRNNLIKKLHRGGKSYKEISRMFKIDKSRVYQIVNDKSTKVKKVEVIHS